MNSYYSIKHFIVTLEKGRVIVSRARELVPNHTYEIIRQPKPLALVQWNLPVIEPTNLQPSFGIRIEESVKRKTEF